MIWCGTSGFAYPSWKPGFYPETVKAADFLRHYATRLNCVEINYTFHRNPPAKTLEAWVDATPPSFLFAVKAHRRITHIQRLKDAGAATEFFLKAIDPLRSARRLGPVLFQLPPKMKYDPGLLDAYLEALPTDLRYAWEFREPAWLTEEVYSVLRARGAALCVAESEKLQVPEVLTAAFVYRRLRKPEYSEADLEAITERARNLAGEDRDVFLIFKHEETPAGAVNAERVLRSSV